MDTQTAITISHRVSELTQLVTGYQAQYGRYYKISADTPLTAVALQQAIFNKQVEVAELLDSDVRTKPGKRWLEWWRWQETLDIATCSELARESNHLIACCAYHDAQPEGQSSFAIHASQVTIAGMLHPDVCCTDFDLLEEIERVHEQMPDY
ncbi:MAG: hypothetical protein J0L63_00325 [Anaerolineae bacterium]|nr:hypothetical protein [Anaerolineae bacterium]MBN8617315.1 hypothetical protein [Anaerolineae bacterium]